MFKTGKYKGKTFEELYNENRSYLNYYLSLNKKDKQT
jgi:hypothetical protein